MGWPRRLFTSVTTLAMLAAPQENPVFRAEVREVRVDVQVTDGRKNVAGLGPDDFQLFDQEVSQTLLRFGRESEPLALVILIDVSGSMRRYARQMSTTATAALAHLRPGDEVSLMVFAKTVETVTDFTGSFESLDRDIEVGTEQPLPTGTAIYNAILAAAQALEAHAKKKPNMRRAVLILTDNESLNYQIDDRQVLEALYSADAVLNAIVTSKTERPKQRPTGGYRNPDFAPTDIFKIAEKTGGEAYRADRADRVFPLLLERLRNRYTLIYRPPEGIPGEFRAIRVALTPEAKRKHSDPTVRARSGYYTASR